MKNNRKEYKSSIVRRSNKRLIRGLVLSLMLLGLNERLHSQSLADSIRNEFYAINKAYDSAFFLTFNVSMRYASDTIRIGTDSLNFTNSVVEGQYTFHNKKALYQLGDITYMRNDSFAIAAYEEQRFLLVDKVVPGIPTGSFLPVRMIVDSMMTQLVQQFTYSWIQTDSVVTINMSALDGNAAYESITISYEPATHYLLNISFRFKDFGHDDNTSVSGPVIIRKATMSIQFSRYRVAEISEDIFSESRFIYFDGPDLIRPSDKYRDYTVYKNY